MTITELKERLTALEERIKEDALKIIGNTAVRMFKENFQDEGFFGQRWREVKRRQPQRSRRGSGRAPVDAQRKILTGTGDLGRRGWGCGCPVPRAAADNPYPAYVREPHVLTEVPLSFSKNYLVF